ATTQARGAAGGVGGGGGEAHAGAEEAIAAAGENGTADVRIGSDALPGRGQRAERRRIQSVCALGAIYRDQRDVWMVLRKLEPDRHDGSPFRPCERLPVALHASDSSAAHAGGPRPISASASLRLGESCATF